MILYYSIINSLCENLRTGVDRREKPLKIPSWFLLFKTYESMKEGIISEK
jgi:hypothetical protein